MDADGRAPRRRSQWTLGRRLRILLLGIAPVPLGLLLLISTYQYESKLRTAADLRLAARAKDSGLEVYRRLIDLDLDLRWVIREAEIHPGLNLDGDLWPDRFRRLLWAPDGQSPPTAASIVLPPRALWPERLRSRATTLVEALASSSEPSLWLVVPDGRPEGGAVWGEVELHWLWTTGALPAEGGIRWLLLGAEGRETLAFAPSPAPELEARVRGIAREGIGGVEWKAGDGKRWRARFVTIPLGHDFGHPGLVAAVSEIDTVADEAALLRRTSWLVAIGSLLFTGILLSRKLEGQLLPLSELLEGTRRLAAGELSARVEVAGASDLEQLGTGFNQMAEELDRTFHLLQAGNEVAVAALASTPVAERVVNAFVDRISAVAPPTVELVVILSDRRGVSEVIRRSRRADEGIGRSSSETALTLPSAVAATEEWVPIERSFVTLSDGRSHPPSLWRSIRRGSRIFGAIGLVGFTGTEAERRFVAALEGPSTQLGLAISRVHLIDDLDRANWGALTALARAVDAKSPWTRGHSERVTGIAVAIGQQLALSEYALRTLRRGALLHDVGKIGVPSSVLDKQERLTPEEMEMLRSHVEKGVRILEPMEGFLDVLPIVWQHHERLDGSGYPRALKGDEIDPLAALVAVADVFEALSASRPYRPARDSEFGMEYLREGSGIAFDRACVDALESARRDTERWPYPELAPTAIRTPARGLPRPDLDDSRWASSPAAGAEGTDVAARPGSGQRR